MGKTKEGAKKGSEIGQRVSFELQGVEVTGVVISKKEMFEYTIQTDGPLKATITLPKEALKWACKKI
jgi:hypothetical protein